MLLLGLNLQVAEESFISNVDWFCYGCGDGRRLVEQQRQQPSSSSDLTTVELMQSAVKKVPRIAEIQSTFNGIRTELLTLLQHIVEPCSLAIIKNLINIDFPKGDRFRERGAVEAPRGESEERPQEVSHPAGRRLRHPVPAAADGGRGRLLLHRQRARQALQGHEDPRGR